MSETIGDLMQFAKDCNEETVLNMPREKLEVYVLKLSTLANALHTNVYKATMAATYASAMALHSEINNRVMYGLARNAVRRNFERACIPIINYVMAVLISQGFEMMESAKIADEMLTKHSAILASAYSPSLLNNLIDETIKEKKGE